MSRMRNDYESTLWSRIEKFVNGEEPEQTMKRKKKSRANHEQVKREDVFMEDILLRMERREEESFLEKVEEYGEKRRVRRYERIYRILAVFLCFTVMAVLLVTVSYLPPFGNPDNPANNEVIERYIEKGLQETGTVNVVTGMILNYRGFDTMGETHVLFIAATSVTILLLAVSEKDKKRASDRSFEPKNDIILQKAAKVLVPVIFMFGIYVIMNGHLSPGGGFSGGAMIGAGMILYAGAFGFAKTDRIFNGHVIKIAKISALCLYVSSLSYYFYTGANGIENHIPLGTPGNLFSSGLIFFINIFVGTEVACTMYTFYALFRRGGL